MSVTEGVPVLDLAADDAANAALMGMALRKYGFFYCKNHGIDDDLLSQQCAAHADPPRRPPSS